MSKIWSNNDDAAVSRACRDVGMGALVSHVPLHPDTEPAAIAAAQQTAVRAALRQLENPDPETISAHVCLPVSIVIRRLGEIMKSPKREKRVAV